MEYRVARKEYVRKRPEWMTKFLLELSPILYEGRSTIEDAQANLSQIKKEIIKAGIPGYKGKLQMSETPKAIYITNQNGKNYLRFRIERK